jgi:hypothetical protein
MFGSTHGTENKHKDLLTTIAGPQLFSSADAHTDYRRK